MRVTTAIAAMLLSSLPISAEEAKFSLGPAMELGGIIGMSTPCEYKLDQSKLNVAIAKAAPPGQSVAQGALQGAALSSDSFVEDASPGELASMCAIYSGLAYSAGLLAE